MRERQGFGKRRRQEAAAFAVIRGLSFLTMAILALIIGFVLYKGLRYGSATRSTALPYAEASPEGLRLVVNKASEASRLEYQTLRGIYTDEYINWSKIDGEETELLPLAVDPRSPAGARAAGLLFGDKASPPWGGLVQTLPSERELLARVAATQGAIGIVSKEAAEEAERNGAGVKTISLRRLGLAANSQAFALVDNREVEDLSDARIASLLSGKIKNWKELGGPDLSLVLISPPEGSSLESAERAAGYAVKGPTAPDMESYLASLASTPGAVGLAFAEDVAAEADKTAGEDEGAKGIGLLTRSGVEVGWNLSLSYLTEEPRLSGRVGGISTIIFNTLYMLLLTLLMAAPLGVAAAVYLVEYARQGPLVRVLRLGTETLAGIPSIIFGLFGMLFFVNILHFGFGLLSGCLTLTLMILPTIVRTSEEALKSVPKSLREGSLALGATKLKTIVRVVLPAAAPGITTGLILGIGRAVGETAALLFTMGSDYKAAKGLFSSARVLSAHVYLLFAEGISFDRAFSTATVLIVVVLAFNLLAKLLVRRMGRNGAGA
jgi:phosphate transport system permease protein